MVGAFSTRDTWDRCGLTLPRFVLRRGQYERPLTGRLHVVSDWEGVSKNDEGVAQGVQNSRQKTVVIVHRRVT